MADMSDKMKATVQPHVPEPVIAVGVLQPAGTWGAMGGDQLSGIVGSLMRKNANKRSAASARTARSARRSRSSPSPRPASTRSTPRGGGRRARSSTKWVTGIAAT